MEDILKMLGVGVLDESQQTAVKDKLESIIDLKVQAKLEESMTEEKERLTTVYEEKFEDYKKDITSKFSNFLDEILEEELVIPEKIYEYAHKGELYGELIEQFKMRLAIDEGVLDEEAKSLLREARDEIVNLRSQLNETIEQKLQVESDAQKMASSLYLKTKCDGLTEAQKQKITSILEGADRKEIDRKFPILVESMSVSEAEGESCNCVCPECGATAECTDGSCSSMNCPECDAKMEDETSEGCGSKKKKPMKETKKVVKESVAQVDESEDAFSAFKNHYVKILKEGKF